MAIIITTVTWPTRESRRVWPQFLYQRCQVSVRKGARAQICGNDSQETVKLARCAAFSADPLKTFTYSL